MGGPAPLARPPGHPVRWFGGGGWGTTFNEASQLSLERREAQTAPPSQGKHKHSGVVGGPGWAATKLECTGTNQPLFFCPVFPQIEKKRSNDRDDLWKNMERKKRPSSLNWNELAKHGR